MQFGTDFMNINAGEPPSVVPGMLSLLQLDPLLKQYRQEIERRYITYTTIVGNSHPVVKRTLHSHRCLTYLGLFDLRTCPS